ncbi:MAG: tandem-95 repeat protein, partial [Eubacteriales bacterium]
LNTHEDMLNDPEDLTISSFTQPMNDGTPIGNLAITDAGKTLTISDIPANWNGILTFDYVVVDIYGNPSTGSVTLTVNYSNDAPIGNDDTASMTEDGSILIDVLYNDVDVDTFTTLNNIPEIDPVTGANKEELILLDAFIGVSDAVVSVESNQVRFTPSADWNGANVFTYTFRDHWGVERTAEVTVNVAAAEDNPVVAPDNGTTEEDVAVVIDLFANDSDIDIDPALNNDASLPALSADIYEELDLVSTGFGAVTILDGPAFPTSGGTEDSGTIQITGDGIITYTPPQDWVGRVTFTYQAEDKDGNTAQSDVFILIGAVNDPPLPPTFVTPIQDSYYKDGQTVAVAWLEGSDADNDPLTYVVDFYDGTSWTNGVASFTPGLTLAHALGLTGVNTDVARYRARTYDGFAYSDYAYSDTFIIDNEAPVSVSPALQLADGSSYIPGTWVNENVYASESGGSDRLSVEYWMGINYGPLSEYAENGILALTTTGEYTVNFGTQDVLQNYRVVANQIVRIDKLNPIAPTVVFDHTDRRRGNVTVTFDNYSTDPGGSGNKWIITPKGEKLLITGGAESPSYDIRRNNDYTFGIMDAAGNRTDFIVTVDWIIPPPPVETSASPSDDDDDDDGDTSDYDDDDGDGDKDTGGPEPTPLNQEDDEQDGDVIGQTQDDKKSGGKDVLLKTRKAGAVGAVAGSSMGLLGLLVLWFFVLTNFTVKLAMVIDGKIVKRSKRRWILFAPKGSKTLGVNFIIKKPHQMKIAGTVVKKGLAKKMRAGKIVVTINGKPLKTFNVPKDIDTKYEKTVRI